MLKPKEWQREREREEQKTKEGFIYPTKSITAFEVH
jgi:hypothetical protein